MTRPHESAHGGSNASPTAHLVLMRHGETTWNTLGTVQGQSPGSVLTALGRSQVRATIAQLSGRVDAVVSSDLARAVESAHIVATALGLSARVDPGLRERNFGVLEGLPGAALVPSVEGISGGVVVDENAHPANGESLRDLYERSVRAARRVGQRRPGQRTLVVTHGGPIRMIRAYADGRPLMGCAWDPVANASLWPVEIELAPELELDGLAP